jgi:RNA polymerase sigma factor (sigma-70 family)
MPERTPVLADEELTVLRSGLRIVALRSLGDPEAAEEAAQETIVRGLEALENDRLDDPENPGAYFRGILRHVIADTLRHRRRVISLEGAEDLPDPNPTSDALHALISKEQKEAVVRVLTELSPRARECLHLCFYVGLPPREVAVRLGEPGPRIRKRRSRALKQIREILLREAGPVESHESSRPPTRKGKRTVTDAGRSPGSGDET